jgi:multicomponent Na+:H+ antiporter subunit D
MDLTQYMPAWLFEHGPAFLIAVPLLLAAITAILPNRKIAWWSTTAMTLILAISALALAQYENANGLDIYRMGGWNPPYGISLVVDALSAPILVLIAAMAVMTMLYALPATVAEVEPKKRAPFYAAFLLCMAGLMGMVVTGDAFNVFVFLEVSSISTYVLVAMGASRDRRALVSAYNYLILGSIGATFFVIGIGFLYMETGTLNMADMARILSEMEGGSRVSMVAFGFIIVGLGLKLAMFPLHNWLPGAYAYSPTPVAAFLASTATKAALYLLIRFTFFVFNPEFDYVAAILTYLIVGLGVVGMLFASAQAIFQTDIRRALAFSSVAQVGYMLLGIGIATTASVAAGYLHLINHAIIKGGLFLAVGAMWYRFGITRSADFRGLSKTMPWTMGAFTVCGFSLIGVPFTAGFVSKVALAEAAAEQGYWWSVGVIMLSSILAIFYVGRVLMTAYFQDPPEIDGKAVAKNEAPLMMLIPMWILALSSVAIGMNIFGASDLIVGVSERAADALLSAGG